MTGWGVGEGSWWEHRVSACKVVSRGSDNNGRGHFYLGPTIFWPGKRPALGRAFYAHTYPRRCPPPPPLDLRHSLFRCVMSISGVHC